MNSSPPRFLIESIAHDAVFFLRLLKTLIAHPESALLSPALMPMASLFVVESYTRISEYFPDFRCSLLPESLALVRPARHRTKLLLSNTKDVNTIVTDFERLVREEREAFMAPHTGWLGPIKRMFQPDMGLSVCDGHMFSTTHGTRFLIGVDIHNPSLTHEAGRVLGSYCASLVRGFVSTSEPGPFEGGILPEIIMKDIKCEALYGRGAMGTLALGWAGTMAMVLANINFVHRVLRRLVPHRSRTFLKMRLLCAFHALHSIRLAQDRHAAERTLPPAAAEVFRRALGTPDSRWLKKRDDLRDTLMHFQPARIASKYNALSYDELVTHLSGGRGGEELEALVDRVLEHLAITLAMAFDLKPGTFWYATVPRAAGAG